MIDLTGIELLAPQLDRRGFMAAIAGSLLAAPLVAEAQKKGKVYRIGFLIYGPGPSAEVDAFRQELRELGYIEGQNVTIEYRFARGQVGRMPELAAELVRFPVDVFVVDTTPALQAVRQVTRTMPIVMAGFGDPVAEGFVASLTRPGGNITGLSWLTPEVAGKRLELLHEVLPKLTRVAVLLDPNDTCRERRAKRNRDRRPRDRSTIPIIMATPANPIQAGFVQSLARPGGNVTGLTADLAPETIIGKQLALLKECVPRLSRVAVLWNPTAPAYRDYFGILAIAARQLSITPQSLEVQSPMDFEKAFDAARQQRVASPVMWKKRSGAFFRLVQCAVNRPPWPAATGGTRHGQEYLGSCASAGA